MNAKVIAVWGANGSGKTTTAVNLAFSLSQRNFTVGLISSNIYYGEMQMLCGCNVPDDRGIYHALMGGETKNMLVQAGKHQYLCCLFPISLMLCSLLPYPQKR